MRRVGDNRNPVKDKFGAGKNGFGPGNPQTGQPATTPGYELFDSWQEEMAGVVEGSGIELRPGQNDQLLKAIRLIAWGNANGRPTTLDGYGITDGAPIKNPRFYDGLKVSFAKNNNLEVLPPNIGPGARLFSRDDSGVPSRLEFQGSHVIFSTSTGADAFVFDANTGAVSIQDATLDNQPVNLGQMKSKLSAKADKASSLAGYGITDAVGVKSPTLQVSAKVHIGQDRNIEVIEPNAGAGGRVIARDDRGSLARLELQGALVILPLANGADGLVYNAATGDVALPGITSLLGTLGAIFGITQSTADLTASRALGTTYYNTTPRPILIECCIFLGAAGTQRLYKGGVNIQTFTNNAGATSYFSFSTLVLPGQSYSITATGAPSFTWYETR
ncbi:hypothetical protein [Chromobacterium haemolyticum]|uniref:hypothetical protein n=1 Tax=Chromobacterium haemolyticum TaxID=394935 RepID=UPI001178671D|nr:hypothetical protein [Chromobacterium haemolyticum]